MYVYVEFSYNQDLNVCIFCAVKVTEIGCFLIVCIGGNSICDEEKIKVLFFDGTSPFIKDSYYDFLSEELKMIYYGKAVINMH